MGFTGQVSSALVCYGYSDTRFRLARWINAPSTGLELIRENIMRNHHVRRNETESSSRFVDAARRVSSEEGGS